MIDIQSLKRNLNVIELAARYTELTPKTAKEMGGACPKCGGDDRFYCQVDFFACRHCHPERGDVIEFVQWANDLSFREACTQLGGYGSQPLTRPSQPAVKPEPEPPPDHSQWEARAAAFVKYTGEQLWNESNSPALSYLLGRGFSLDTIEKHHLGYNPKGFKDKAINWGTEKNIWIPAGIIIPSIANGKVKNVKIRLMSGGWRHIAGGLQTMYLVDYLNGLPIVMCEAEFDALSVKQEVGDKVAAVAICGANAARQTKWIAKLVNCKRVILAFDADEPGDKAAIWWQNVLGSRSVRLRPVGAKDANEMLQANGGDSLRRWVLSGLNQNQAQAPEKIKPIDLYRTASQSTLFPLPEIKQPSYYEYEEL